MSQTHRIAAGGLIDRAKVLNFRFDGKDYQGHAGDTLASALLANGVRLMGRSFKYHRPRGPISAGVEEPNAIVELRSGARREPNTRATVAELYDGLEASSQNRWPSLSFDALAVNDLLSPFFAAGFYYKTFMWPKSFWEKVYEPAIRRAAGLFAGNRLATAVEYGTTTLLRATSSRRSMSGATSSTTPLAALTRSTISSCFAEPATGRCRALHPARH